MPVPLTQALGPIGENVAIEANRYTGKAFLRLLDSYVLDCIGQLADAPRESLRLMEPKLNAVYATAGTWQEVVRSQMDLPVDFPDMIRKVWSDFLDAAKSQGIPVDPNEFVARFVDENFPETSS